MLLSVQDVAKKLNVHERTIRRYINNGEIEAKRVGGQWRIEEDALDNIFNNKKCCSADPHLSSNDFCVFMDSDYFSNENEVQTCLITDYLNKDKSESENILVKFKALAYDALLENEIFKLESFNDEIKLRIVVWCSPKYIEKVGKLVKLTGE
jgi:excisionase family DNA binding protein